MGVDLAKALFVWHARHLNAAELAVMGFMAVTALDKPNGKGQAANIYRAGWEPLAQSLGYEAPPLSDAAKTRVKRAIKGLRDKGLIVPIAGHAQAGTRQVYRIEFGGYRGSETDPQRGSETDPQEGVRSRPNRGSETDPPRRELGGEMDLGQDTSTHLPAQLTTARGDENSNEVSAHKFKPTAYDSEACECGKGKKNRAVHPLHLLRGA
jgi:hypothetical protein